MYVMCCGIPMMCPADLAQGLDLFLTDAVRLIGQTAFIAFLLFPLALWENMRIQ